MAGFEDAMCFCNVFMTLWGQKPNNLSHGDTGQLPSQLEQLGPHGEKYLSWDWFKIKFKVGRF